MTTPTTEARIEAAVTEAIEEAARRARSVVAVAYKARYAAKAAAKKAKPTVAEKRCCGDWLAKHLAALALDDKQKLVVPTFEAILDANGVKHHHWNRTTPGWQGRLRMTGRLSLQRVVADRAEFALPDGTTLIPPRAWCDRILGGH